jgi:hypothetical protein
MKTPGWLKFFILLQVIFFSILVFLLINQKNNLVAYGTQGIPGIQGLQGEPGYTPIKNIDYVDGKKGNTGATGQQGIQGIPGPISTVPGPKGDTGEIGKTGEPGPEGKSVELRCKDFTKGKKSQIQWRNTGDESWQVLYEIDGKCKA